MLPVDYLPAARRDFDESFNWYSEQSTQAAIRFLNAIDAALSMIAANPNRFEAIDAFHRACPVKRFPFRVVYQVEADRILVVAIAHAKRQPGYWKNREDVSEA